MAKTSANTSEDIITNETDDAADAANDAATDGTKPQATMATTTSPTDDSSKKKADEEEAMATATANPTDNSSKTNKKDEEEEKEKSHPNIAAQSSSLPLPSQPPNIPPMTLPPIKATSYAYFSSLQKQQTSDPTSLDNFDFSDFYSKWTIDQMNQLYPRISGGGTYDPPKDYLSSGKDIKKWRTMNDADQLKILQKWHLADGGGSNEKKKPATPILATSYDRFNVLKKHDSLDIFDFTGFIEKWGIKKLNQLFPKDKRYGRLDPPPQYLVSGRLIRKWRRTNKRDQKRILQRIEDGEEVVLLENNKMKFTKKKKESSKSKTKEGNKKRKREDEDDDDRQQLGCEGLIAMSNDDPTTKKKASSPKKPSPKKAKNTKPTTAIPSSYYENDKVCQGITLQTIQSCRDVTLHDKEIIADGFFHLLQKAHHFKGDAISDSGKWNYGEDVAGFLFDHDANDCSNGKSAAGGDGGAGGGGDATADSTANSNNDNKNDTSFNNVEDDEEDYLKYSWKCQQQTQQQQPSPNNGNNNNNTTTTTWSFLRYDCIDSFDKGRDCCNVCWSYRYNFFALCRREEEARRRASGVASVMAAIGGARGKQRKAVIVGQTLSI